MKFSHQIAVVLSLLAKDALAQAVTCQTALGTSSLKVVPTTTSTTVLPSSTTTVTLSPTSTVLQGLTSTLTVFYTLTTRTTTTPAVSQQSWDIMLPLSVNTACSRLMWLLQLRLSTRRLLSLIPPRSRRHQRKQIRLAPQLHISHKLRQASNPLATLSTRTLSRRNVT